jgi:hypothetical protein
MFCIQPFLFCRNHLFNVFAEINCSVFCRNHLFIYFAEITYSMFCRNHLFSVLQKSLIQFCRNHLFSFAEITYSMFFKNHLCYVFVLVTVLSRIKFRILAIILIHCTLIFTMFGHSFKLSMLAPRPYK